jgi:hypothetical protein
MDPLRVGVHGYLIVIAGLEKIDPVFSDDIDDPVLLGQPPRPRAREDMLQRLGLADAMEGISQNGLDEVQSPKGNSAIDLDPMPEIFPKLRLKDGDPLAPP